jgi:hypothetical protein
MFLMAGINELWFMNGWKALFYFSSAVINITLMFLN